MSRVRLVHATGLVPLALLIVAGPVLASSATVRMTEVDERYHFSPQSVTVSAGDTVTWRNTTDALHTVTSNSGGELDSSTIGEGDTFSHTFSAVGTFSYHCTVHSYMMGSVTVLAAGATLPQTSTAQPAISTSPGTPVILFLLLAAVAPTIALLRRLAAR